MFSLQSKIVPILTNVHVEPLSTSVNSCKSYELRMERELVYFQPFRTFVKYLNNFIVGTIFTIILKIRNRFSVRRKQNLLDAVYKRERGTGLLTISNHQSMLDDPGLWAALLPWWRTSPSRMRWSLCTEDVFFAVSHTSYFFR